VRHDNGSAVTIGAYDGVHIGHRRVIEQVRRRAADASLRSVVVTFDKNPAAVINPGSAPPRLTDLDQKLELLAATGVDHILVLHFDAERAKEPAEDFVTEVLVTELGARVVVVGDDFHFGNERRGNVALLREMGEEAGYSVEPVHLVQDELAHEVVSSTRIRALIAKGELVEAAALLGRPHEVRGLVVVGEGAEAIEPPALVIEIPAEILLPPAGEYLGFAAAAPTADSAAAAATAAAAAADSAGPGPGTGAEGSEFATARLVVLDRLGGSPQRIEIFDVEAGAGRLPLGGAEGDVIRARFR
jgi:riboflavin kinase / FMN adenylyltransferase